MDLFEAIRSQRAIRRYTDDPVPMDLIHRILEFAVRAPSGGNQQPWSFIVITNPSLKARISVFYRRSWDEVYGPPERAATLSQQVLSSASGLAENMAEAPVLIMACIKHDGSPSSLGRGASIYPAVQNLMLAARGLGLGTALTTLHKRYEAEIKNLLDIPDNVETAALIPVGYPASPEHFGGSRRRPVLELTYLEQWGKPAA
jgi:nitroreductase|tara:strand:+ start:695 stop:1300 length:606 start_codon:yes stop_codon:yes gene_type:complete